MLFRSKMKRNLVRQMEASLYTLKLPGSKQEGAEIPVGVTSKMCIRDRSDAEGMCHSFIHMLCHSVSCFKVCIGIVVSVPSDMWDESKQGEMCIRDRVKGSAGVHTISVIR